MRLKTENFMQKRVVIHGQTRKRRADDHVSSLPGAYGIGSFGREARQFIDFLSDAGCTYWQVLPLYADGRLQLTLREHFRLCGQP